MLSAPACPVTIRRDVLMDVNLTDEEQAMLHGDAGTGPRLAMRIVTRIAETMGAKRLRPIVGAHVDSCLYHGRATLDFATRLVDGGATVNVPTTLNVSSLDLLHPELYRGDHVTARHARSLMTLYEAMGCRPTWTCAPYQLAERPRFGDHVAWAESNAIVFANSVLGARTHRYGDFMDIAAAITARVPDAGLHTDDARRGEIVFDLRSLPAALVGRDVLYPILGLLVGRESGSHVPVLVGVPGDANEDQLKAFGAAAASSGSVGIFHAVGRTPEATSLTQALGDRPPVRTITVDVGDLIAVRDRLGTSSGSLSVVSLGTPHYSADQLRLLAELLAGRQVQHSVKMYVSTGRDVLRAAASEGVIDELERSGVQMVTDTCTYVTPIIEGAAGLAMTDSAKWAYYAPGNLGLDVVFGTTEDCVESAIAGTITRDDMVWNGV